MKNIVYVLILTVTLLFVSCVITKESSIDVEFVVLNKSNYSIKANYFRYIDGNRKRFSDTTFLVTQQSAFKVYYYDDMGSTIKGRPLGVNPDSVYITFNNERRIIYRRNDQAHKGILDIGNYQEQKVNDGYFIYTYTITQEDYDNAQPIVAKK